MSNELEITNQKPRLVKGGQHHSDPFEAVGAAAFSTADGRKLRSGQDKLRLPANAAAALDQELLNLKNEMADREAQLRLAHGGYVAKIMAA
jgi:hypothetical protein